MFGSVPDSELAGEVILCIPDAPPSWNTFYAGAHHWKRKQLADKWHLLVRESALSAQKGQAIPRGQGAITVSVNYPDKRRRDPDNICAKLLIDGLVHAGILPDDSDQYVSSVTTRITRDKSLPRQTTITVKGEA